MIIYSIEFYVENKFGNDHMYLKNEKDHWILSLTNTETLLPRHKASLKKAGFNFIQTFKNSWKTTKDPPTPKPVLVNEREARFM